MIVFTAAEISFILDRLDLLRYGPDVSPLFFELGEEESAESKLEMSITKNPPSVRYLRITDKGMKGPAQINFKAIRVYDKKNAK